jgi:GNAT superfamily N-acetyltransferase
VVQVTVRDAQRGDASAVAEVTSAAVPYLVRSAARTTADMKQDGTLGRRRWVGLVDGEVAGTAHARQIDDRYGEREVFTSIEVRPDRSSRGVGTALLAAVADGFPGTTWLRSVANDDPISLSFVVRNGFLPEAEHSIAHVAPATVEPAGEDPEGLRSVTLDALPDLRMLLETHNLAAADDRSGTTRRYTMYQLRSDWWDNPDNAPDLSFGLLGEGRSGLELAAFTSVQVDRERGRTWSSMTATHPAYRGRGLASWVKRRMLNAVAEAGIADAWTAQDESNVAMLAVDRELGYVPAARSIRVGRRLGTSAVGRTTSTR